MKLNINTIVNNALKEDKARADITSQLLIPKSHISEGYIIAREPAILCGIQLARATFKNLNPKIRVSLKAKDGQKIKKGAKILTVKGPTRSLLAAERTALNFLGYLSGIATLTEIYVKTAGKNTQVVATRKTTPGNRLLEKYAVVTGGGGPHRLDLSDMVLMKDNHRALYRHGNSLTEAVKLIRKKTRKRIEIEVDTLNEFKAVLEGKPAMILLDNMTNTQLKKAVKLTKQLPKNKRPTLEASGGITLKTLKKIAQTGVDQVSVGALTHSHTSIDFSMEIKP